MLLFAFFVYNFPAGVNFFPVLWSSSQLPSKGSKAKTNQEFQSIHVKYCRCGSYFCSHAASSSWLSIGFCAAVGASVLHTQLGPCEAFYQSVHLQVGRYQITTFGRFCSTLGSYLLDQDPPFVPPEIWMCPVYASNY
jgi:hypothetical protein